MTRLDVEVRFSQVPEWVLDHEITNLSANAVRLYGLLQRYGNSEGAVRMPSRSTLARRMGVRSTRTVDAACVELEAAGALRVKSGQHDGTSNKYVLSVTPTMRGGVRNPLRRGGAQPAAQGGAQPAAHNRESSDRETPSPDGEGGAAAPIERLGRDFVGFFVDEVRRVVGRDPLESARGRIGRHANELRRQGLDDSLIRSAITEVVESGLNVGALLTVADQLHRGGYRGRRSNGGLSAEDIFNLDLEAA